MAVQELFTTSIGLLSFFTIAFVVVMGVYLYGFVLKHMKEDELKAKQTPGGIKNPANSH